MSNGRETIPPRRRNPRRACKAISSSEHIATPSSSDTSDHQSAEPSYHPDDTVHSPVRTTTPPKVPPTSKGSSTTKQTASLTAEQDDAIAKIFSHFDPHGNGRLTYSDLQRVADDHGLDYTGEEMTDMIRLWDTSGTMTISKESFLKLAIETGYISMKTVNNQHCVFKM